MLIHFCSYGINFTNFAKEVLLILYTKIYNAFIYSVNCEIFSVNYKVKNCGYAAVWQEKPAVWRYSLHMASPN